MSVEVASRDGSVTVWSEGIGIYNTLGRSPGRPTFSFSDTCDTVFEAFDRGSGGIINHQNHFPGWDRSLAVGSAIDLAGGFWNSQCGGGCVDRFGPAGRPNGKVGAPGMAETLMAIA
jgi:sugar lactone lactonase YvrE